MKLLDGLNLLIHKLYLHAKLQHVLNPKECELFLTNVFVMHLMDSYERAFEKVSKIMQVTVPDFDKEFVPMKTLTTQDHLVVVQHEGVDHYKFEINSQTFPTGLQKRLNNLKIPVDTYNTQGSNMSKLDDAIDMFEFSYSSSIKDPVKVLSTIIIYSYINSFNHDKIYIESPEATMTLTRLGPNTLTPFGTTKLPKDKIVLDLAMLETSVALDFLMNYIRYIRRGKLVQVITTGLDTAKFPFVTSTQTMIIRAVQFD